MKFDNGEGHSLGYDAHAKTFCDPNLGVMELNSLTFGAMVKEAAEIYCGEEGTLTNLYNVSVVLAKDKVS